MPVTKGDFLIAINKRFGDKSLSKTFKENLAEKGVSKIENIENIDSYLDSIEYVVLEASTEADRRATEAVKKLAPVAKEKIEGETKTVEEIDETEGMTKFEKMMYQKFNSLESKVVGFETQQTQKTLTEMFSSHQELKGLGIPKSIMDRFVPTKLEDLESSVSELKNSYSEILTQNKLSSLGKDTPNNFGGGKKTDSEEVSPAIKAFAESQK